MVQFLLNCFLYGVAGGLIGFAWTQVISPYMIFSPLGLWMERTSSYVFYGTERFLIGPAETEDMSRVKRWDHKLPFYRKFLKAIGCIYCISTWFTLLIFIAAPVETPTNVAKIPVLFIGIVAAIGTCMAVAEVVCRFRILNRPK